MNGLGEIWQERRRAILLASDAIVSRDNKAWSEVDDLLFSVRSARPAESETFKKEEAPKHLKALLDDPAVDTFPLPFARLNKCLLGGLRRGQTFVLAADPAIGKSVLADQWAEHMALNGAEVLLMMNEMQPVDRAARWVQRRTGIHEEKVLSKDLSEDERATILKEAETFPFDMVNIAGESFRDVADRLRQTKPDVAVVDLLSRFDYQDERSLRLGMAMLTNAAHQSKCGLVVLHHLNQRRQREDGSRPSPTLQDLRDSGSVGGFADIVGFLSRDSNPDDPVQLMATGKLRLAKVRAGRVGGIRVRLNSTNIRFDEVADGEALGV
jgi:replicative DNA helicase